MNAGLSPIQAIGVPILSSNQRIIEFNNSTKNTFTHKLFQDHPELVKLTEAEIDHLYNLVLNYKKSSLNTLNREELTPRGELIEKIVTL